ncbi:MAG TPA: CobW family GTP-binding protein [Polyangia bacterium]|nr:CobW family GTP-binding protein [Polyangia bacterium]
MNARLARRGSLPDARPIYVVGGFLGSGKTTLLLRILNHLRAEGTVPAVIMNEYGEESVDGRLLAHGHDGAMTVAELSSGCVCCDLSEGLTDAVKSLLESTTGPILVETTGLAIVGQVATAVEQALEQGGQNRRARLASVIVAVDAVRFGAVTAIWKHGPADLAAADTIVVTKCDRADAAAVRKLTGSLQRRHAAARVLTSSNADVDPGLLVQPARSGRPTARRSKVARKTAKRVANSAAGFSSVTCQILGPVNTQRLGPVLGQFAPALARVKGFVRTTEKAGLHAVQWVPGALDVTPHRRARISPHLVVIAKDLDWEKFVDALDGAIEAPRRRASGGRS